MGIDFFIPGLMLRGCSAGLFSLGASTRVLASPVHLTLASRTLSTAPKTFKDSHSGGEKTYEAHPLINTKKVNTIRAFVDTVTDMMESKDVFRHVESSEQLTYKELAGFVNSLSCGLPEAQLHRGRRLALIMQNDSEQFTLRLAAQRIGVAVGLVDIKKFQPHTIRDYLRVLQPNSLVLTPKYDVYKKINHVNELLPEISENYEIGRPLQLRDFPALRSVFHTHKSKHYDGWYHFNDLFWKDPLPRTQENAERFVVGSDLAQIHFSRFFAMTEALGFTQSSVVESALSFGAEAPIREKRVAITGDYHTPEVSTCMLACMAYGSYVVTSSYWLKVPNMIKDIAKEQCSVLISSPSELKELLAHPLMQTTKFSLQTIVVLTNPCEVPNAEFLTKVKEAFGADRIDTAFISDGSVTPFLYLKNATSMENNQLGYPILNTEVKISDRNGDVLPVGQSGRLMMKGVNVASTSSMRPHDQSILEGAGWLDSGLKASMNSKGHVFFSE